MTTESGSSLERKMRCTCPHATDAVGPHVRGCPNHPEYRPHCGKWPFPTSDLDMVMLEDNAKYHQGRGCCDGA